MLPKNNWHLISTGPEVAPQDIPNVDLVFLLHFSPSAIKKVINVSFLFSYTVSETNKARKCCSFSLLSLKHQSSLSAPSLLLFSRHNQSLQAVPLLLLLVLVVGGTRTVMTGL